MNIIISPSNLHTKMHSFLSFHQKLKSTSTHLVKDCNFPEFCLGKIYYYLLIHKVAYFQYLSIHRILIRCLITSYSNCIFHRIAIFHNYGVDNFFYFQKFVKLKMNLYILMIRLIAKI